MNYIITSAIEFMAIIGFLWLYTHKDKVIAWEEDQWAKIKKSVRKLLRKSKRIVAWAETPAKHGKPDAEWITGQVKVFGDVWR